MALISAAIDSNYSNGGGKVRPKSYPYIDYFIGFNRATGANAQNDEADNEVTITTSGNNGEGYSQSFLKAHLIKGESYTITNFAGTGQNLVIKADDINIGTVPGVATICVAYEGQSCVPVDPTNQPTPPVSYIK